MSADSPRTILGVDDDGKIVRLVRAYLEREDYRVTEAADGRAALAATGNCEFALDDFNYRFTAMRPCLFDVRNILHYDVIRLQYAGNAKEFDK